MQLYNSLTKQLETFKPLNDAKVGIYTCGPTVYDRVHIGNLMSFIVADTLKRALELSGFSVKHVMNITDVDDKTIGQAVSEQPNEDDAKTALKTTTEKYEQLFYDDLKSIGIDINSIDFVRATDNISQMQALIKDLYDSGFAYIADDGIYFSIEKYKNSGKTYGQLLKITAKSTGAARVDNDEYDKEHVHDFALWKTQKPGEPSWEFTLNGHKLDGRPGWHIECSTMSTDSLGQPFDIHTGGVDLIFPHHENEIAQSTASRGGKLANFFVHNEHLLVDGKKMAKSLGNFYVLNDISKHGFEAIAFRLLVLQSHYRHQLNFTWDSLKAASVFLNDLRNFSALRYQLLPKTTSEDSTKRILSEAKTKILSSLQADLATPKALSKLSQLINNLSVLGIPSGVDKELNDFINFIDKAFGLQLKQVPDISDKQKRLINRREQARKSKDYAKSDVLRSKLEAEDLGLRDTPSGALWYRI